MRQLLLQSPIFLEHDTGRHVENAGRLQAVQHKLQGLEGWQSVAPRPAEDDQLLLAHQPSHLERLNQLHAAGASCVDADTVLSERSLETARMAVGGGLLLVDEVLSGQADLGFALVRPPGHHATPDRAMGFCLFSNVALAALYARQRWNLERIFILDWDVHHGNGTQDCLLEHPQVTFCSFHQWPLYPGSGWHDERGQGNLYNLPLPAGCGDGEYLFALERLVGPLLDRVQPQLILLSAGYDAHQRDPLGSMEISTPGFASMASWLRQRALQLKAPLLGFLEGGYDLRGLSEGVAATLQAWSQPGPVNSVAPQALGSGFLQRIYQAQASWQLED
jgi:acetoin utilization deacetylase AcuC-like enzyme